MGGDVDDYMSNSTAAAVQGIYLQSQHNHLLMISIQLFAFFLFLPQFLD